MKNERCKMKTLWLIITHNFLSFYHLVHWWRPLRERNPLAVHPIKIKNISENADDVIDPKISPKSWELQKSFAERISEIESILTKLLASESTSSFKSRWLDYARSRWWDLIHTQKIHISYVSPWNCSEWNLANIWGLDRHFQTRKLK